MPALVPRPSPTKVWIALATLCGGAVLASFVLTAWLALNPCHLCIFQRTLFMLLALCAILAAVADRWGRSLAAVPGGLFLLVCTAGIGAAAYQSWLQFQPIGSVSCVGGQPDPIEGLIEWLGQQVPALFLATGFCEDKELVVLGLSLANWAFLAFVFCLAAGAWTLWRVWRAPR